MEESSRKKPGGLGAETREASRRCMIASNFARIFFLNFTHFWPPGCADKGQRGRPVRLSPPLLVKRERIFSLRVVAGLRRRCVDAQLNSWAVQSAEVMSHGDLKISYQTSKCLSNPTVSCVEAVMVDVRHNASSSLSVSVDRQFHVVVDGRLVPDSTAPQFTLRRGHVVVKRASSLFMAITGFGFRVLYDANGKIYVTMEPFYSRRVSVTGCTTTINFSLSK